MTMAVGMTSSSGLRVAEEAEPMGFMWPRGGEPPAEEKSELLWGERERLSEELLSSHCCRGGLGRNRKRSQEDTHGGQGAANGLVLQGRLGDAGEGIVGGLLEALGGGEVEGGPVSFVIVRVMKTLLRRARVERQRGDIRRGTGHGGTIKERRAEDFCLFGLIAGHEAVLFLFYLAIRTRPRGCTSRSTSTPITMLPEWSHGPRATFFSVVAVRAGARAMPCIIPLPSWGGWNAAHGSDGMVCFGALWAPSVAASASPFPPAHLRAGIGPGVRRKDDGGERRAICNLAVMFRFQNYHNAQV
jgi:hypothetical protein